MKYFLFALIAAGLLSMASCGTSGEGAAYSSSYSAPIYEATWTNGSEGTSGTDTLTNTESDTLTVTPLLLSNWRYNYVLTATQQSGTKSVITILQENSERTSGTWYEVERDTATGASTTVLRLHGASNPDGIGWAKGVRHRVILTGTGTQATTYTLRAILKKD